MSPNPRFGIRKRNRKSTDTDTDVDTASASLTRRSGAGSISPTSSSTSTEPTSISEIDPSLASSLPASSGILSASRDQDVEPEDGIEERDGTRYVTLTVTRSSGTYVTLVELGDTAFPTSYSATQTKTKQRVQTPGIPTGTIVGIVVGIFLGVMLLVGVFYVYLLRARHLKSIRRRRRRARRASASSGGPGPAPAAPPAEGGGPFPPANP